MRDHFSILSSRIPVLSSGSFRNSTSGRVSRGVTKREPVEISRSLGALLKILASGRVGSLDIPNLSLGEALRRVNALLPADGPVRRPRTFAVNNAFQGHRGQAAAASERGGA